VYQMNGKDSAAVNPASTAQQHAAQAYKTSSYHGISERETMAEAFRVMITNLYTAKDAFTDRKLDVMCDINVKTLNIVNLLASGLHGEPLADAGTRKSALFMASIYNDVFIRLTNIVRAPKPAEEFDALIALLTPVYRRWLPAASAENAGTQRIAGNASQA
jgi:hypothetical protein